MKRGWAFFAGEQRILPYFLAILFTVAVTFVLLIFRDGLQIATVAMLYLLPVGASAALWGLGPGIVSALVSFFLLNYFFLPPYGTLMVHKSQDILVLFVFLVLTVSISQLVGSMTRSLAIARDREYEITRLNELSLAFSKLHREKDILNNLAQHTLETFQADQVEVFTEGNPLPGLIRYPEHDSPGESRFGQPTAIVPLQGNQRLLGEIRIWRTERPINLSEERLLQTFARQGVLALERARLVARESRARLLEESDRMKSALLASVSHELRTPLATITGALSSLVNDEIVLDEAARKSLIETASEEADRLNRLVGNLLDMTRLEAGAMHIHLEARDIQDVVGSALEELKSQLRDRTVTIDLPTELPLVNMDFVLIERVLVNVIDNAIKYSPPESVIEIQVHATVSFMEVKVADRGAGIPPEDLQQIFEKFYRVKRPNSMGGTGLGLSICKGIIQAHGGAITAENRPGGGTIITISLPVH
jgi:two-component system sensor histidine kinase KdpD